MEEILEYLRNKYTSESYTEAELKAVFEYCFMVYAVNTNQLDLSMDCLSGLALIWVKKACCEVLDKTAYDGAIQYSESGYSITFDSAGFSKELVNLLTPFATPHTLKPAVLNVQKD